MAYRGAAAAARHGAPQAPGVPPADTRPLRACWRHGLLAGSGARARRPVPRRLHEAFLAGEMLTVDLLYGDHEGGQRTISRFILTREDDDQWRCGVVRHWALDGIDPRVTGPMSANTDERQSRPRGGTLL